MTNDLPEFKSDLLESLTRAALEEEKESYSSKLESFETYSKRKLSAAQRQDKEFMERLTRGARLVRDHFLQLGGKDESR